MAHSLRITALDYNKGIKLLRKQQQQKGKHSENLYRGLGADHRLKMPTRVSEVAFTTIRAHSLMFIFKKKIQGKCSKKELKEGTK